MKVNHRLFLILSTIGLLAVGSCLAVTQDDVKKAVADYDKAAKAYHALVQPVDWSSFQTKGTETSKEEYKRTDSEYEKNIADLQKYTSTTDANTLSQILGNAQRLTSELNTYTKELKAKVGGSAAGQLSTERPRVQKCVDSYRKSIEVFTADYDKANVAQSPALKGKEKEKKELDNYYKHLQDPSAKDTRAPAALQNLLDNANTVQDAKKAEKVCEDWSKDLTHKSNDLKDYKGHMAQMAGEETKMQHEIHTALDNLKTTITTLAEEIKKQDLPKLDLGKLKNFHKKIEEAIQHIKSIKL